MDARNRRRARRLTELGFRLFEAERWKDAEAAFRGAAVVDPDDEDAWIGLGCSLRQRDRTADAAVVFGVAAAIARSSGAWPTLLAAEALLESGSASRARQALAWFDELAKHIAPTKEQADLACTLRQRLENAT